jgi:hypothetical protein
MKQHLAFFVLALSVVLIAGCADDAATPPQDVPEESAAFAQEEEGYDGDVDALAKFGGPISYRITFENLSPLTGAGMSQPFSPPVVAVHSRKIRMFRLWHKASDELRQIAEDAVNGPMVSTLESSSEVLSVTQGAGVILPGQSAEFMVNAERGYHRFSIVAMLVNTNDGITGVSGRLLPLFGKRVMYLRALDAGTERNTELQAHIPGPCCGTPHVRVPTDERIRFHRGITGRGDLSPTVYGWNEPVAKLTIERVY